MPIQSPFSRIVFLILSLAVLSACDPATDSANQAPAAGNVNSVQPDLIDGAELQSSEAVISEVAARVNKIADRYYAAAIYNSPETFYFAGLELERHDGMEDNTPMARGRVHEQVDELLQELEAIDPGVLLGKPEWVTYVALIQTLRSNVAERICQTSWWNVNQMGGWHSGYSSIAQLQPVGTAELRAQSLTRWGKFAAYIDQEIDSLKVGLHAGYSAPKTVVQRVIDQIDGLLAIEVEESPFYSPASRDEDAAFAAATHSLVVDQIYPALRRYRDYLAGDYMDQARSELSVTANPNGLACYEASIRSYTTLDRSGKEVYELGLATVEANKAKVIELGQAAYGLDDFSEIMIKAKADPEDRFSDKQELLQFSKDRVKDAEKEMPEWVGSMPTQPVEVVPFDESEEGTGRSAHYRPASADRPAEYRIPLFEAEKESRGGAEATAFHETWPGHHLQVAIGQSVKGLHPVTQIIWFSGPGEGWARYSEALAEEMGLYTTTTGPILRRAWPARGMAADPGIHLMGWTREQAIEYMMEAGRFPESQGDAMVDRIAILPGQLTAYDSGGLEILALRKQAEEAFGDEFDIREFHDQVLVNGTIPLTELRTNIEKWIDEENN
jgi:uncharacterized protein (DUF885 family)